MRLTFSYLFLLLLPFFYCGWPLSTKAQVLELSGDWTFQMDSTDQGLTSGWYHGLPNGQEVHLPGSLADNGIGFPVDANTDWTGKLAIPDWEEDEKFSPYLQQEWLFPFWLSPKLKYTGVGWYQKEVVITRQMRDLPLELLLERVHWEASVWVDGQFVGQSNRLGTPQIFQMPEGLSEGNHLISLRIDNRIKEVDVGHNAHSISDHTQTNWHGVIGKMQLKARAPARIRHQKIMPMVEERSVMLDLSLENLQEQSQTALLEVVVFSADKENEIARMTKEIILPKGSHPLQLQLPMGDDIRLWDEFDPYLYQLESRLSVGEQEDVQLAGFGMRKLGIAGTRFTINDRPLFLRGTLDCAIFPKTAYPPTDQQEWKRIFSTIKAHGLNHIRFHSWCPPKAAFDVADALGLYLQIECGVWAHADFPASLLGEGNPVDDWIMKESRAIVEEFGNHPSFCLFLHGNEPMGQGQEAYLASFINYWKARDNRRFYTSGAGWTAQEENDFHNIQEPRIQHWGEGLKSIINQQKPNSNYDWRHQLLENDRPVVSHEIGQWCAYPNLKEIDKYQGNLQANNYKLFQKSLAANGLSSLAEKFLMASGKLQALCYKADIEAALRTPGFAGFQLLGLSDFSGQGTAPVGVLDAFWEEKGYIRPEEFRSFCQETVPLARFDQFVFKSGSPIKVKLEVAHFGEKVLEDVRPRWVLKNQAGKVIKEGQLPTCTLPVGNVNVGEVILKHFSGQPEHLIFEFNIGTFKNQWDLWLYPDNEIPTYEDIQVVQKLEAATIKSLTRGGKVLLTLPKGSVKPQFGGDIAVGFSSIFWNTMWTEGQPPHTMGLLLDPQDPLLKAFPTEQYSNYQWWDALTHADAMALTKIHPDLQPEIRVIDDWFTNRNLGLAFEVQVGKGKLLVTSIDLVHKQSERITARQLLISMLDYMHSADFQPKVRLKAGEIEQIYEVKAAF
ncbi:sugar-binding domain-containing protein [Persicobacter diffluens]|uniref:Beta-galactosidase n=1 Tax=Persicobacter diffluens TaxID=981 RepID=A0AAN4W257_9BACT|nr:beta-galactosidase [Persicobacter diffluens]